MIFHNPAGAPELACDACGCRWFDRMTGCCYECGAEVGEEERAAYRRALEEFAARRQADQAGAPDSSSPSRSSTVPSSPPGKHAT